MSDQVHEVVRLIRAARHLTAFTGAGISVESGLPPFRGENGLWSRYDPKTLELSYFRRHPIECWKILKEIFYKSFASAQPNEAHFVLARLEQRGFLKALITQNVDGLHQQAGSRHVIEFHGHCRSLTCISCGKSIAADPRLLETLPPRCGCSGALKPDLVFFGEGIPETAWLDSFREAGETDVMLVVGSTGEVYPAASIPTHASHGGAKIIEINPEPSQFTESITDVFISTGAVEALRSIESELERETKA